MTREELSGSGKEVQTEKLRHNPVLDLSVDREGRMWHSGYQCLEPLKDATLGQWNQVLYL